MKKKRAIILGAGISGLSAAHALLRTHDVVVLDRAKRAGGWLETTNENGFLFEAGPRTFRSSHSEHLLKLTDDLGLKDQLVFSDYQAQKRFLFFQGRLRPMPSHLLGFLFSSLLRDVWRDLLMEWKKPSFEEEETLWQFAERRFGKKIAERFFDALSLGVYAADSKSISVDAAFPAFKQMEREHGSITKAILKSKNKKSSQALFSFREGVQVLIDALMSELASCLQLDSAVHAICKKGNLFEITTQQGRYLADLVIIALPPYEAGRLLEPLAPSSAQLLREIEMTSLSMVQLGYDREVLNKRGFGYLVPSVENLPLYGVVFDSCIFPMQNQGKQTRLTVMLPYLQGATEMALSMVAQHLNISLKPNYIKETLCEKAIPLPKIGHRNKVAMIEKQLGPHLLLAGNYLQGVSVNDCVSSGFNAARKAVDGLSC